MSLPYNKKLIPNAKTLRKQMTPEEKHLWYDYLRNYPIRFQRQKAIHQFIVDFYCASVSLVIELDGSHHYDEKQAAYDQKRSLILSEYDITILRFTNTDIRENFEGVCYSIDSTVKKLLATV